MRARRAGEGADRLEVRDRHRPLRRGLRGGVRGHAAPRAGHLEDRRRSSASSRRCKLDEILRIRHRVLQRPAGVNPGRTRRLIYPRRTLIASSAPEDSVPRDSHGNAFQQYANSCPPLVALALVARADAAGARARRAASASSPGRGATAGTRSRRRCWAASPSSSRSLVTYLLFVAAHAATGWVVLGASTSSSSSASSTTSSTSSRTRS